MNQALFIFKSIILNIIGLQSHFSFTMRDIRVIDWLMYSPDLNSIKKMWAIMKAKLVEENL